MIETTLSLELDMPLTRTEREGLTAAIEHDPGIGFFEIERGRRTDLLHLTFVGSCSIWSRIPQSVQEYLYGKNMGYTPLRNLHRLA